MFYGNIILGLNRGQPSTIFVRHNLMLNKQFGGPENCYNLMNVPVSVPLCLPTLLILVMDVCVVTLRPWSPI